MDLTPFREQSLYAAMSSFFQELNVPVSEVTEEPASPADLLSLFNEQNAAHALMNQVYFLGMVNESAFDNEENDETLVSIKDREEDYDGILIFGIELNTQKPTRTQLAEITRLFNREWNYTPVTLIFKYNNQIAFANSERLKYKQAWREGEKAGKVSLLRDIDIENTHSGHERILAELEIPKKGKKEVDSFEKLYAYWQDVFSVSLLNKKFYEDLSNWYFWAIKHVTFPNKPNQETVVEKYGKFDQKKLDEMVNEHKATNVIRLLTRLLFVWFMKEKKLIPDELFDLKALQKGILKQISPERLGGLFPEANLDSIYYKAILQNLFFATLNCPIEEDHIDKRKRGFRGDGYGAHRGIDYLMRYKKYFKDPEAFLELVNKTVPFLNGGLFECLDDKYQNQYIDGFSDQMTKGEQLIVPDYLFFGVSEKVDLSHEYGKKTKKFKESAVKGLINILESYKFTITENTPIEEDVALDPELLGKVFENLLASYNPETKTTARKQTGSFYTPREIVNYMVDESLIAYLKNRISNEPSVFVEFGKAQANLFGNEGNQGQQTLMNDVNAPELKDNPEKLDEILHELVSFNTHNPLKNYPNTSEHLLRYLNECTILDPACGSGAFPMGILQKMVHILQKIDPDNKAWQDVQEAKTKKEAEQAFDIDDKEARNDRLNEISEAFDQSINDPDYARKLFLIENCIYGVDIQPIATQISKLRFFISLVVEQKVNPDKPNFGIRPLPNLETKFVTANTLIGIEKPKAQYSMFETGEVKQLEKELKIVRHKLFSARTKETKLKYRKKDEELRNAIGTELKENGWPSDTAEKLAGWDPYDQNASSSFFEPEWMFDIKDGFDVVIANPPYIGHKGGAKKLFRELKSTTLGRLFNNERMDVFYYFFHMAINITNDKGIISFITTNYFPTADSAVKLRQDIYDRTYPFIFVDFNELTLFESARGQHNLLSFLSKNEISDKVKIININSKNSKSESELKHLLTDESPETTITDLYSNNYRDDQSGYFLIKGIDNHSSQINEIVENMVNKSSSTLGDYYDLSQGVVSGIDKISPKHGRRNESYQNKIGQGVFVVSDETIETFSLNEKNLLRPWFKNSDISKYYVNELTDSYLIHTNSEIKLSTYPNIQNHLEKYKTAILSRNYESGELSKAKRKGAWWALSSSRREFDFAKPKIVSPQRSYKNTFGYTQKEWCASADVYFITSKPKAPFPLVALVIILNSSLYYLWLYNRGKRKGDMLELYLTPLAAIPLPNLKQNEIYTLNLLGSMIFTEYSKQKEYHNRFDQIANGIIIEHYFLEHMKDKKIDVLNFVERDIDEVMQGREFEKLSDAEKEQVIEALYTKWSDPDNEVVKRMGMFKEKSPEILKVILES